MSTRPDTEPLYVAIGASDVVGVGAADPERDNWASVLHRLMPRGTKLLRLARSGITLREANAVEVPRAAKADPTLITVWNCVNDLVKSVPLDDYVRELDFALSRLVRDTRANILVLNVPDLSRLLPPELGVARLALVQGGIRQWNEAIATTVDRYGDRVSLLDLFPASGEMMERGDTVASDRFHMSAAGYQALAELVWQTIQERGLLGQPPPLDA